MQSVINHIDTFFSLCDRFYSAGCSTRAWWEDGGREQTKSVLMLILAAIVFAYEKLADFSEVVVWDILVPWLRERWSDAEVAYVAYGQDRVEEAVNIGKTVAFKAFLLGVLILVSSGIIAVSCSAVYGPFILRRIHRFTEALAEAFPPAELLVW